MGTANCIMFPEIALVMPIYLMLIQCYWSRCWAMSEHNNAQKPNMRYNDFIKLPQLNLHILMNNCCRYTNNCGRGMLRNSMDINST